APMVTPTDLTQFIRGGDSETLNSLRGISPADRKLCAEGRQVVELHDCGFRKTSAQIAGQCLQPPIVTRIRQGERSAVLHIAACRVPQFGSDMPSCFVSVAEHRFPQS